MRTGVQVFTSRIQEFRVAVVCCVSLHLGLLGVAGVCNPCVLLLYFIPQTAYSRTAGVLVDAAVFALWVGGQSLCAGVFTRVSCCLISFVGCGRNKPERICERGANLSKGTRNLRDSSKLLERDM